MPRCEWYFNSRAGTRCTRRNQVGVAPGGSQVGIRCREAKSRRLIVVVVLVALQVNFRLRFSCNGAVIVACVSMTKLPREAQEQLASPGTGWKRRVKQL